MTRAAALHAHTSSPSDIHGLQRTSTLPPMAAVRDFGLPGKSAGCAICRRYSHSELPLCMLIPPARPISMGFSVPVRFRPWLPSGTLDYRAAALHAHTSSPSDIHGLQRTSTLPPMAAVRDFPGKKVGKKSKKWLIISGNDYIIYLYAVARKGICVRRRRE